MFSCGMSIPRGTGPTLMLGATSSVFPRVPKGMDCSVVRSPKSLLPSGSCTGACCCGRCCPGDTCLGCCCIGPVNTVPTSTVSWDSDRMADPCAVPDALAGGGGTSVPRGVA
eukprot:7700893-Alexandrium_andersonii.AAC.1